MLSCLACFTAEDKHTYMTSISPQHIKRGWTTVDWTCRIHRFLIMASEQLGMLTIEVPEDRPCAQDACYWENANNQAASSTHDSASIGCHIVLSSKPRAFHPFIVIVGGHLYQLYPPVLRYQKWRNSQTVRHILI